MDTLLQDIGYGFRSLRKSPVFTAIAILTLALGLGANTAIFSVTNAVLLHPYTFPDLDRLVVLQPRVQNKPVEDKRLAPADYLDLLDQRELFQGVAGFRYQSFNLARGGEVEDAAGYAVSTNLFDVVGVKPALGRSFTETEGQPGRDNVVMLSHGLWQRRFGSDGAVLGKTISVDGHDSTIIGIMPAGFNYPIAAEIWKPLALTAAQKIDRTSALIYAVARLQPGKSLDATQSELSATALRLQKQFPATNDGREFSLQRLREEQYTFTGPLFLTLQAGAFFVLLLACANLGTLTLIRALGRQRELAVRVALGAGWGRMLRFFAAEAALFCMTAGLASVAASFWCVDVVRASMSASYTKWIAGWDAMHVDSNVLAVAGVTVLLVAVALSAGMALHASRINLERSLKEGGRGGSSVRQTRVRGSLVVLQIVLTMILLVGAGLVISGFQRLQNVFSAFDPAHLLRFRVSLPESRYPQPAQVQRFYDELLARTATLPGAEGSAVITNNPASSYDSPRIQFEIEGQAQQRAANAPSAERQTVSPQIFSVLHVPLLDGRLMADPDGPESPRVIVISRSMAQQFWPGRSAIGQRIRTVGAAAPWLTVVGVVGDIQMNWWEARPSPTIYFPYAQNPPRSVTVFVRTAHSPLDDAAAVRRFVAQLDPQLAPGELNAFTVEVSDSLAPIRVIGVLMLAFGLVALALSAVGIYGVVSQSVAQSTHEFGVRMALGAAKGDLLRLVTGKALRLVAAGLAIGCGAAVLLARMAQGFLAGVITLQPGVFVMFALLLFSVALLAAFFPARRAAQVDPMVALRHE